MTTESRPPSEAMLVAQARGGDLAAYASGVVTTVATASGPVDVHGLSEDGAAVWLADNTTGLLYRLSG